MNKKYKFSYILIIAIIAKLAILSLFIKNPALYTVGSDSPYYLNEAKTLLKYGQYAWDYYGPVIPIMYPLPVYIFFLAGMVGIFGNVFLPVALVQNAMMIFSAFLLWKIGKELFGEKVAFWSALIYAVEPFNSFQSNFVLTDTFFSFFTVVFLFYAIRFLLESKTKDLVLSSLFLGIATLTRPVSLYFSVVLIGFIIFMFWRDRNKVVRKTILVLLTFLLVLSPWLIRNYVVFGRIKLTTITNFNLYFYNAATFLSVKNKTTNPEERLKMNAAYFSTVPAKNPQELMERDDFYKQEAMKIIGADPLGYAKVHAVKMVPFFLQSVWEYIYQLGFNPKGGVAPANMTSLLMQGDFRGMLQNFQRGGIVTLLYLSGIVFWLIIDLGILFCLLKWKNFT